MKKNIFIFLLISFSAISQNENFSKEERIYALSTIWKEISYNFSFPERFSEFNMDSLYLSYLPKMEQDIDNYEFYRLLSSYISHFRDAHTRIYTTSDLFDNPPLFATGIDNSIIVKNVSKELEKEIPIGSEIVKINNIPIIDYIKDSIAIYISASTNHWKWNKAILELFNGRKNSQLNVTIRKSNGRLNNVLLTRNYKQNKQKIEMANNIEQNPINIKFLPNNIAYIQLNSFLYPSKDHIEQTFINNLPNLKNSKGIIIDIRNNRGGSDSSWELIAKYLITDKEFQVPCKFYSKKNISTYVVWGKYNPKYNNYTKGIAMEEIVHPNYKNEIPDSLKLNQPLIVLSGKYTGSAAEDFLLLMKETRHALIIGTPSVGCMSEPIVYPLGEEYGFMFSIKKYVLYDGKQPIDTGILPDIYIEENLTDYKNGTDIVLNKAIKELKTLLDKHL